MAGESSSDAIRHLDTHGNDANLNFDQGSPGSQVEEL